MENQLEAVLPTGEEITATVIVPVYNKAVFLDECIQSILGQSCHAIQLLLVDDGSTDESLAICRRYEAEDCRVQVLSQPNRGVSAARNLGLDHAAGKYIVFVDADDWVGPDYVKHLTDGMENGDCQMAVCNYYEYYWQEDGRMVPKDYCKGKRSLKQYLLDMAKKPIHNYYGVPWNRCFERRLIEQNRLRFDETLRYGEDTAFTLNYLPYVRQVNTLPGLDYYYRYVNRTAVTKTSRDNRQHIEQVAAVYRNYKTLWCRLGWFNRYKKLVQFTGARIYFDERKWLPETEWPILYDKCLRENGFSRADYLFFAAMRMVKRLVKK